MPRRTCLFCHNLWDPFGECCWICECPYFEEMFHDTTGELQESALTEWLESYDVQQSEQSDTE